MVPMASGGIFEDVASLRGLDIFLAGYLCACPLGLSWGFCELSNSLS